MFLSYLSKVFVERTVLSQMTEAPAWPSKTVSARLVFRFHMWTKPFPDLEDGQIKTIIPLRLKVVCKIISTHMINIKQIPAFKLLPVKPEIILSSLIVAHVDSVFNSDCGLFSLVQIQRLGR